VGIRTHNFSAIKFLREQIFNIDAIYIASIRKKRTFFGKRLILDGVKKIFDLFFAKFIHFIFFCKYFNY